MSRWRFAYFTPYLPAPLVSGGCLRIHHLSRALSDELGAEIDLYARAPRWRGVRHSLSGALAPFSRVTVRHDSIPPRAPGIPAKVAASTPASLERQFLSAHRARPYDAVFFAHSHGGRIAPGLEVPWLLDEHNIESDYAAEIATPSTGQRASPAELARWERGLWKQATEVSCISASDAERIRAVRGPAPIVVPNGADVQAIPFRRPKDRTREEVLFVGSMRQPQNAAAARLLAQEVMPRVWRSKPEARLVLCGSSPPADIRGLATDRVSVTGTVDSVGPYLDRATVYANALAHGAGSSLKVVEALAAGIPLVSTAVGVRGHPLTRAHYISAEGAESIADAVVRVLEDPAREEPRTEAGRQWAESLDWRHVGRRYATSVERVLTRASRTP